MESSQKHHRDPVVYADPCSGHCHQSSLATRRDKKYLKKKKKAEQGGSININIKASIYHMRLGQEIFGLKTCPLQLSW